MILAGNNPHKIASMKQILDHHFKIKDLSSLKFFLSLKVARNSHGISLCQRKYTFELLESTRMLAYKLVTTPMVHLTKFVKDDGDPSPYVTAYRRLLGQLLYLTNTRPDISFSDTLKSIVVLLHEITLPSCHPNPKVT